VLEEFGVSKKDCQFWFYNEFLLAVAIRLCEAWIEMTACFLDQVGHLKDASNKAYNAELKLFLEVYLPNPVCPATFLLAFL
jgi:hypothetical protein